MEVPLKGPLEGKILVILYSISKQTKFFFLKIVKFYVIFES